MLRRVRFLGGVLLAVGVLATTTACATHTYGYGRRDTWRDFERRAYENGYRDGLRAGERDGRSGRPFSVSRHDDWRDADDGYYRGYASRDEYRRAFRSGFEAGYRESYDRYTATYGRYPRTDPSYPRYPTYPSYPPGGIYTRGSAATENGYRDGFEAGRNDARDGRAFDPRRTRRYREGDHDYDRRYGSRDAYKQEYRDAFQQGYEEGYRRRW
jgi:flagellar biosynthesis/type III secretory pathway protein FliH